MQLCVVGTADSVLIREVTLIQSVLYREVPQHISVLTTEPNCWLCTCAVSLDLHTLVVHKESCVQVYL